MARSARRSAGAIDCAGPASLLSFPLPPSIQVASWYLKPSSIKEDSSLHCYCAAVLDGRTCRAYDNREFSSWHIGCLRMSAVWQPRELRFIKPRHIRECVCQGAEFCQASQPRLPFPLDLEQDCVSRMTSSRPRTEWTLTTGPSP